MKPRKGIILAGGSGTRLYPLTISVSKQLMPIYDKPTIYYPLATLMLGNIKDILIITTPQDKELFERLLGDGSHLGIKISYATQDKPNGLAEAYIIAEEFLNGHPSVMILGDNFFHGDLRFVKILESACHPSSHNCIFAKKVSNPQQYGVVEMDMEDKHQAGCIRSLEEKPLNPKSEYAIPGIYFFDETAPEKAKKLAPSSRGELEIISLCREFLDIEYFIDSEWPVARRALYVYDTLESVAWLDTGTHEGLLDAAQYVKIVEERHGYKIACVEKIALDKKWVRKDDMLEYIKSKGNSSYYQYIKTFLNK
jgi:glucose-1-phosphate thymidylyltransferase